MSITVRVPAGSEYWNSSANEFHYIERDVVITMEHSLVSIHKWEQIWHQPFLDERRRKTNEQMISYLKCMTLTKNIDDVAYLMIPATEMQRIKAYIEDPMTATTITSSGPKGRKEIKTAEVLYADMVTLGIPFECRKWHLNSLITLIGVCAERQKPPKKMSKSAIFAQNRALNRQRRAALKSKG